MKTGILLINLGTPDSPSVSDVRKYLTQFLNDPLVIDIHPIARFFLVNFIIVPFRAPKSAKLYKQIWTQEGSPLLIHGNNLKEKLQKELGENYLVEIGMRYQNPSIQSAFRKLKNAKVSSITVIPLYPQYASSSTGSTIEEVKRVMKKEKFPEVKIIDKFYRDENFINACAEVAKKYKLKEYEHFIFSYHGLPERQIKKVYPDNCKLDSACCSGITEKNSYCYRAGCYETTRLIAQKLHIAENQYTVSFQSRLDDKWLKPYSDKVIIEKAKAGVKKILVFSPAFVADCLETIYEIGVEYQHLFKENGGEQLQLVESLNVHPAWIKALKRIVTGIDEKLETCPKDSGLLRRNLKLFIK